MRRISISPTANQLKKFGILTQTSCYNLYDVGLHVSEDAGERLPQVAHRVVGILGGGVARTPRTGRILPVLPGRRHCSCWLRGVGHVAGCC